MASLKNVDIDKVSQALLAWNKWMKERIYIANPMDEDLDNVPPEPAAAACLYILPPGWEWVNDIPVKVNHQ